MSLNQHLLTLFSFLYAFLAINFVVNWVLSKQFKTPMYKKLVEYWFAISLSYVLHIFNYQNSFFLSLIYVLQFFPMLKLLEVIEIQFQLEIIRKKYYLGLATSVLISYGFYVLGSPFAIYNLPIAIAVAWPLVSVIQAVLANKHRVTYMHKIFSFIVLNGISSVFAYSLLRENASPLVLTFGYGSAFALFQLCSIILPLFAFQDMYQEYMNSLEHKVAERTKDLAESKRQKEMLLRVLIHDIANPLQIVKAYADKGSLQSTQEGIYFNKIKAHAKSIIEIVDHVRCFEYLNSGKAQLDLSKVAVSELLDEVVELFNERYSEKSIKLVIENNLLLANHVHVDRTAFVHSVLGNLLSNALKFSYEGGQVYLRVLESEGQILFVVRDYGTGIPKDRLDYIFSFEKPTTQLGTKGEKGTGFGMPIVKTYIENFGGKIQVNSNIKTEEGTEFVITLPSSVHQTDLSHLIQ